MREPAFLRQNKDKWRTYERLLFSSESKSADPDQLTELYVQLTNDLAYARTFYPQSQIVKYLNGLAAHTHLAIYKNRRYKKNRFAEFFIRDLPLVYRKNHHYIFYSLAIFVISAALGWLSHLNDDGFINIILGDTYVNMTEENIEKGDPLGVYGQSPSFPMFVTIAANNIYVSFLAFVLGIFFSIGSMWLLFNNGVMVGAFFGMFFTKGLIGEALPIIFIHGTLELSAIVIAGGAGIAMGHSFLFPKTHSRLYSLQQGALQGIKMIAGLVPVFIMAAFLESYITRLTDMHIIWKLLIIILSLGFVVWYYFIYPKQIEKTNPKYI